MVSKSILFVILIIFVIFIFVRRRAQKWRTFDLLKSVLGSRQRLVDAVVNGEKPKPCPPSVKRRTRTSRSAQNVKARYFQELALLKEEVGESTQSSEDEQYPGV